VKGVSPPPAAQSEDEVGDAGLGDRIALPQSFQPPGGSMLARSCPGGRAVRGRHRLGSPVLAQFASDKLWDGQHGVSSIEWRCDVRHIYWVYRLQCMRRM
jgi:hypothetical protein